MPSPKPKRKSEAFLNAVDGRQWIRSGQIKQRETVVEGFENLPKALVALFEGANTGKMMVQIS